MNLASLPWERAYLILSQKGPPHPFTSRVIIHGRIGLSNEASNISKIGTPVETLATTITRK